MNRRGVLAVGASAVASLAGCSGFAGSSSDSASDRVGAGRTVTDGPDSGTETDPETVVLRADTDRQPIWLADPDDDERPTPRHDGRHVDSVVVDSESRADRLSVDPGADGEGIEPFLAATDFDAETVFLETVSVEECFRLTLCRISWQPGKVSTDYARRVRDWDEACAVDERVFEARLVRIPDTIPADSVRAESTSVGTGGCRRDGARAGTVEGGGSGQSTPSDADSGTPGRANATDGGGQ